MAQSNRLIAGYLATPGILGLRLDRPVSGARDAADRRSSGKDPDPLTGVNHRMLRPLVRTTPMGQESAEIQIVGDPYAVVGESVQEVAYPSAGNFFLLDT